MHIVNKAIVLLMITTPFFFGGDTKAATQGTEYDVIDVELGQLNPTQAVIAHAQVTYKLNRYRFEPQKRLDDICEALGLGSAKSNQQAVMPVDRPACTDDFNTANLHDLKTAVRGPGDSLYLTDGHHTFSTFFDMPGGGQDFSVRVLITDDKSDLSVNEFWLWMQNQQLTWLNDAEGRAMTPDQLPGSLGRDHLGNDDFRAAMYFLRDVSWQKPSPAVPFVEFYWADFLRQQTILQPPDDLDDLQAYLRWLNRLAGYIAGMSSDTELNPESTRDDQQTAGQLGRFTGDSEAQLEQLVCARQAPGKLAYALLDSNAQALQHCSPNRQPVAHANLVEADDLVSALIEISSGSQQKWQQSHTQPEWLEWEQVNGSPRWIEFLGYPTNYGIIPDTLSKAAEGGDGDPLDVLVLGSPLPQGEHIAVRIIGVMRMLDSGEQDDKLIAVDPAHPVFADIADMAQLSTDFPAIPEILQTWFEHYKGPTGDVSEVRFESRDEALQQLNRAAVSH